MLWSPGLTATRLVIARMAQCCYQPEERLFTTKREKCGPQQALLSPSLILQEKRGMKRQHVAILDTQEGVSSPPGLSTVVACDMS